MSTIKISCSHALLPGSKVFCETCISDLESQLAEAKKDLKIITRSRDCVNSELYQEKLHLKEWQTKHVQLASEYESLKAKAESLAGALEDLLMHGSPVPDKNGDPIPHQSNPRHAEEVLAAFKEPPCPK